VYAGSRRGLGSDCCYRAAALDERGTLLGVASFATTEGGYKKLLDWLSNFGPLELGVSTPPVTPRAASTMVMVIPSVFGVRDGTAVPDRSDGRSRLFVATRANHPNSETVGLAIKRWTLREVSMYGGTHLNPWDHCRHG
jgi:hypothetical protein